jgi:hypothetical protein
LQRGFGAGAMQAPEAGLTGEGGRRVAQNSEGAVRQAAIAFKAAFGILVAGPESLLAG